MPPQPAVPPKRALPAKEAGLFKSLLQLYEAKQHKKAIKSADQILKKFPEHGETMCMKGLLLTQTGKKEEGLELAKKGARFDLTSHITWHVLGLIYKADRNYEEAHRSFTQALRFDKDNLNLLRDAASLQVQLRLFDALQETRWTLLRLRPNTRANWAALAVASHLGRNFEQADKVLTTYEATLKNVPDFDFDLSETLLYHIRILEESGKLEAALAKLEDSAKQRTIVDRLAVLEIRARLLAKLDRRDEAAAAYGALVDRNPGRVEYIRELAKLKGVDFDALTDETRPQALELLGELEKRLPKGSAPTRLALDVAEGEDFERRATKYIHLGLTRGVPSLFTDLKPLYASDSKRAAIESIVTAFHDSVTPDKKGEPSAYLWALYYLAQHWSKLGQQQRALDTLDVALTHTPTLPELYTLRARVLKRAGAPHAAAVSAERARLLDGQDRFLNCKAAKYLLRAGKVEDAEQRLGLFTRKDAPSPGADLEDLQSWAYLIQTAQAYERQGKLGWALRKYTGVVRVFDDVEDDQYDFHSYVMRRFTLNVYADFISYEDRVRQHPAYITAALAASRIYLRLHDEPGLAKELLAPPKVSDAEKKARKKAKKDAAKEKKDDKKKDDKKDDDADEAPQPSKHDDPQGAQLLSAPDPLEPAAKLLRPLEKFVDRVDVWAVSYDVAVRRKKFVQAVRALNRIARIDKDAPLLHVRLVDLRTRLSGVDDVPPVVRSSLAALFPEDLSPEAFSSQYLQRHSSSPQAVLAVARASQAATETEDLLFSLQKAESATLDVKTAQEALELLTQRKSSRATEFAAACEAKFPLSTVFKSAEEQARLAKLEEDALEDTPVNAEVLEK
ncbi:N-terminal acetyltransferase A, auxiliary subunit [Auricularia subglabra TFB-10046 SS5]|nr:N-terminal acetyltransferase A, auxiliary subunit [Auricularia subglabra TFB-10046 SS5]